MTSKNKSRSKVKLADRGSNFDPKLVVEDDGFTESSSVLGIGGVKPTVRRTRAKSVDGVVANDTPSGRKTRSQSVVLVDISTKRMTRSKSKMHLDGMGSDSVQNSLKLQKGKFSKRKQKIGGKNDNKFDVGTSKKRKKCIRPNDDEDDVGSSEKRKVPVPRKRSSHSQSDLEINQAKGLLMQDPNYKKVLNLIMCGI